MYTLLQPAQEPLDQQWHDALLPLSAVPSELYTYLMPPADVIAAAKTAFYSSGKQANPVLQPDTQYRTSIVEHQQALEALQRAIGQEESNIHIRALYEARIAELIDSCALWLAAADQDQAAYAAANQRLYGAPDAAIHAAVCAWLRAMAQAYTTHDQAPVRQAAEGVLQRIPILDTDDAVSLEPSDDVFRDVMGLHSTPGGYTDQLFAGVSVQPGKVITPAEGDPLVERILTAIAPDYTIAEGSSYWGVLHSSKQVVRPRSYALTPAAFSGIVAHEVGSHLLERVNGLRSPLRLLGSGLDHYEWGNEGRAFMREQLAAGSVPAAISQQAWIFNILKHLGVCLGAGVAGKPLPFSEVYRTLEQVYHFWFLISGQDDAATAAETAAWTLTVRLLKGTDGQGGAYYKDIVYLEGNVRAWQVAAQFPERVLQGDKGKFDIANPEHRTHLQALGIIN
ncbi:MAG TPA: hypothetical protein VD735_01255 [Candidatus Saccharimonadales bacterium]|nr:hypothetical protein [Candidatus Saccharimonadales bacterium]